MSKYGLTNNFEKKIIKNKLPTPNIESLAIGFTGDDALCSVVAHC